MTPSSHHPAAETSRFELVPAPEARAWDRSDVGRWSHDGNWWWNGHEWIPNPYRQQAG